MIGIYKIENTVNGKVYIGQSVRIERRWYEHKWELNNNHHKNNYLQKAWNKYGEECFTFEILEECPIELLNEKEIYWIDYYKTYINYNGYNLTFGGESGTTLEPETIQKIISLYNNNKLTATQISNELKLHIKTVQKYLKNADDVGLCEYDSILDGHKNSMKKIVCLNTKEIFESTAEAERKYGIIGIYENLSHKVKYTGKDENGTPLFWMYYDEYTKFSEEEINIYVSEMLIQFDYRIVCLNTGEIFNNYKDANKFAGLKGKQSITSCCNNRRKHSGINKETGEYYTWTYYKDYYYMSEEDIQRRIEEAQVLSNEKSVVCLNTLKIFPSARLAAQYYGNTSQALINICCRGRMNYTGVDNETHEKLYWMFYDEYITKTEDEIKQIIADINYKYDFRVICLNNNTVYESPREVENQTGLPYRRIQKACVGIIKSCGQTETGEKLNWKYYKDYIKEFGEIA